MVNIKVNIYLDNSSKSEFDLLTKSAWNILLDSWYQFGDVLAIIEQVKLQFRRRHPVESHLCVAEAKWVIEMVVSLFNIPVKVH